MFKLLRENIRIAMGSIRTQLLRTILTVLIIAIGITALVGILTVVSALENTLSGKFAMMGSNTFNVTQYDISIQIGGRREERKVNPIISYPEAKAFMEMYDFPHTHTSLAFNASSTAEVKFEGKKTDPDISIMGVDANFLLNSGSETTKGRNFTTFDISNNAFVCIVGSDFEKGLLKDVNPIDKFISIRGAKFKVIGVLKEKGSTFGNSQDLRVLIPIQVARSLFTAPKINYSVSVMTDQKELIDAAIDNATITMRRIRKLNPVENNNFGITRSDDLIKKILSITEYLTISAWVIGIITIFGSSIALMNIMLVSVTERTREIGIRKAIGANPKVIRRQFLIEAVVICLMGGALGIFLGIVLGNIISLAMGGAFLIPWTFILGGFVLCVGVGILSGYYPAKKASRLDPVEALRYE